MGMMASKITSPAIVYSTVNSGADKKKSKLRVTGVCAENSSVIGEFPAQMASNADNVSISRRHHRHRCNSCRGQTTLRLGNFWNETSNL